MLLYVALLSLASLSIAYSQFKKPVYTLVTYIDRYETDSQGIDISNQLKMLKQNQNFIIFASKHLQYSIMETRKQHNTLFIEKQGESIQNQWFSTYSHLQQQSKSYKQELLNASKLLMMEEAAQKDKFDSAYLIWVDAEFLYQYPSIQHPQALIRSFYEWIQPQWIFLTESTEELLEASQGQGEEEFLGRRLMHHERAFSTFMGGYSEIVTDIKHAYENLLRINLQAKANISILYSLMPLRFPAIIPNSISLNLPDIHTKINLYQKVRRGPNQSIRLFNAFFEPNGTITVKYDNLTIKQHFKNMQFEEEKEEIKQTSNLSPQQFLDSLKYQTQNQKALFSINSNFARDHFFLLKSIVFEAIYLLILTGVYAFLLLQNKFNNKGRPADIQQCSIEIQKNQRSAS